MTSETFEGVRECPGCGKPPLYGLNKPEGGIACPECGADLPLNWFVSSSNEDGERTGNDQ